MRQVLWIPLLLTAGAIAVSCAGAPPPKASQPAPAAQAPAPIAGDQMGTVKEKRDYIVKNGLDAYAPESFAQAEKHYAEAEKVYGTDPAAAQTSLSAALPLYEKTIKDGFAKKIAEAQSAADAARKRADAEKAKVAAATENSTADGAYTGAKKAQGAGQFPEAVEGYKTAASGFDAAAKVAIQRREAADAAIRDADQTIKATDERIDSIKKELSSEEGGAQ